MTTHDIARDGRRTAGDHPLPQYRRDDAEVHPPLLSPDYLSTVQPSRRSTLVAREQPDGLVFDIHLQGGA